MKITVNGKPAEIPGVITINQLLNEVKVTDPLYVTVQQNGVILKRADHDTLTVKEGDAIEFLYFMGGGQC